MIQRALGNTAFNNLLMHQFPGFLYPINLKSEGVRTPLLRILLQVPRSIDMAFLLVPAGAIMHALEDADRSAAGSPSSALDSRKPAGVVRRFSAK